MFFGLTSPCTSVSFVVAVRRAMRCNGRSTDGWAARRRQQVGLQPDRLEDGVRREAARQLGAQGRAGMDADEAVGDGGRRRRLGLAVPQDVLPQPVVGRLEIAHHQGRGRHVDEQQLGHGLRHDAVDDAHPVRLVAVALDRGLPVGPDLQL